VPPVEESHLFPSFPAIESYHIPSACGPEFLPGGGALVTAIDGLAVTGMDGLLAYLSERTSPGQTVGLTVLRANGEKARL